MKDLKWKLFLIFGLTIIAGFLAYPAKDKYLVGDKFQMSPGLDIRGGVQLIVSLREQELPKGMDLQEAIRLTAEKLSVRINNYGLKEPRIETSANTILIAIPGAENEAEVEKVRKIIQQAGKLEFRIGAETSYQDMADSDLPAGYKRYHSLKKEEGRSKIDSIVVIPIEKQKYEITGDDLKAASLRHELKGPEVAFTLKDERAEKFRKLTKENLQSKLAIILDDILISAPVIQSEISNAGSITGTFTEDECSELVTVLNSGSLPASIDISSEYKVGPSLGERSIKYGFYACLISLIAVILFMFVYYRLCGLVANIALVMNIVLLIGVLSLLEATLTLPGIAGIVLTMGMAVDANIIIFERIREERAAGKMPLQAFESGFNRGYTAVFDANITTLIAGVVLYMFGTESIRGFAVTLSIGIITTLFTAITCTKLFMQFMLRENMMKEFHMMKVLTNPKYNFLGIGKAAIIASAVCITAGLVFFGFRGKENFSIDFTGGSAVEIAFKQPQDIEAVRNAIVSLPDSDEPGQLQYPEAEVQSTWSGGTETDTANPTNFIIRVSNPDVQKVKVDMTRIFGENLYPQPISQQEIKGTNSAFDGGTKYTVSLIEQVSETETLEQINKEFVKIGVSTPRIQGIGAEFKVSKTNPDGTVIEEKAYAGYEVFCKPEDSARSTDITGAFKTAFHGKMSNDPFPNYNSIDARVVKNFKKSAIFALIVSWIAMIVYIGIRFQFKYGVAAVVALIHDVLFTLGAMAFFNWALPATWGTNLDIGLTTVAAFLTIVGYSVNDTIITFDRIRENLKLMRRDDFGTIANLSINQTLSRTILTSLTVFLTVVILYFITAQTGGGIPGFAFPMIIGVIVGTYSSIYIATYLLYIWQKKAQA
ncbi:MAG: protein translocase subunit SecD [Planctomycetes bacterium]|nr:protein translocase subunit SecD [Planctomycetota bacterium]